jgi:hypothetical protein
MWNVIYEYKYTSHQTQFICLMNSNWIDYKEVLINLID